MTTVPPVDLRQKYDVPGPRYTSYPTADRFQPIDVEAVFERYRKQNALVDDPGIAFYLHTPF